MAGTPQERSAGRGSATPRSRRADGPARRRRAFYAIGEVCEMLDLKAHVLRYWETQFPELSPTKNRAGNRVYQTREVELIALIRSLVYEERYTIEGARKRVEEMRAAGCAQERSSRALELAFLRSLKDEMESLEVLLTPPGVDRAGGAG
jgi:DNA-binding transcriptional MerR regulator